MLVPRAVLDPLADELERHTGVLRWASAPVDVDPLDLVRSGSDAVGHASFFSSPDGRAVGALGVAHRVDASGPGRLRTLDQALERFDPGLPVMAGFAFGAHGPSGPDWEGFAGATVVVPEIAVVRDAGMSRLFVALPAGSDGHRLLELLAGLPVPGPAGSVGDVLRGVEPRPSTEDWQGLVGDAVSAIGSGALDKVVLARCVVIRSSRVIPSFDLVARLRDRYPACRVFGWQEGPSAFVGASPELLVSRRGSAFHAEPLAGSAPRGADSAEDRRLGDALLASAKDREEHAIVVEDAVARLAPLADEVIHPPTPQLQRFATVQHLATPISGRTGARLLALADALHPTPAVGGAPRGAALDLIDKLEGIDRGWYAGGIGWLDASGDGELAIGLRCALVSGGRAVLFAGNGIVAESDPAAELEETRLKLRPMLDLLTGG